MALTLHHSLMLAPRPRVNCIDISCALCASLLPWVSEDVINRHFISCLCDLLLRSVLQKCAHFDSPPLIERDIWQESFLKFLFFNKIYLEDKSHPEKELRKCSMWVCFSIILYSSVLGRPLLSYNLYLLLQQQQSKSNQTNQGGSQGIEKDWVPRTQACNLILCGVIRLLVCEVQLWVRT